MNDLKLTTSKRIEKNIILTVRITTENGYFSMTGDIIYKSIQNTERYPDKNFISGGCIHDEILKYFPEFKVFELLHLSDLEGVPMHAVANGYYHLRTGFNDIKTDQKEFKDKFCEYYRIDKNHFEELNNSINTNDYAFKLQKLNLVDNWKIQAKKAIKELKELIKNQ